MPGPYSPLHAAEREHAVEGLAMARSVFTEESLDILTSDWAVPLDGRRH